MKSSGKSRVSLELHTSYFNTRLPGRRGRRISGDNYLNTVNMITQASVMFVTNPMGERSDRQAQRIPRYGEHDFFVILTPDQPDESVIPDRPKLII